MTNTEIKVGTFQAKYPVSALKFSTVNRELVNKHSKNFIKKISKYGWMIPIIIDSKGYIIEGHHRAKAALYMGLKTVPTYITDWVDTSDLKEYHESIVQLNNDNKKWSALDYLKSRSDLNDRQYKYVYNKYLESKDILTVGNVINIYFNSNCDSVFRKGQSKIKNMDFANYLFDEFFRLKAKYGKVKFQAFTINRTTQFMYAQCENMNEVDYIFRQLEMLAKTNNATLSSVEMIRPFLKEQLELKRS